MFTGAAAGCVCWSSQPSSGNHHYSLHSCPHVSKNSPIPETLPFIQDFNYFNFLSFDIWYLIIFSGTICIRICWLRTWANEFSILCVKSTWIFRTTAVVSDSFLQASSILKVLEQLFLSVSDMPSIMSLNEQHLSGKLVFSLIKHFRFH